MTEERVTFGEYIRRLRRQKRWDLLKLAAASGLSSTHLSRIENDNGMPNPDTVVRLANALEGDLDRMLELADCLPREILERVIRHVDESNPAMQRSTGAGRVDPGFPHALITDMDPQLREALARQFELSPRDIDGLYRVLERLAAMSPSERRVVIDLLVPDAGQHS